MCVCIYIYVYICIYIYIYSLEDAYALTKKKIPNQIESLEAVKKNFGRKNYIKDINF